MCTPLSNRDWRGTSRLVGIGADGGTELRKRPQERRQEMCPVVIDHLLRRIPGRKAFVQRTPMVNDEDI